MRSLRPAQVVTCACSPLKGRPPPSAQATAATALDSHSLPPSFRLPVCLHLPPPWPGYSRPLLPPRDLGLPASAHSWRPPLAGMASSSDTSMCLLTLLPLLLPLHDLSVAASCLATFCDIRLSQINSSPYCVCGAVNIPRIVKCEHTEGIYIRVAWACVSVSAYVPVYVWMCVSVAQPYPISCHNFIVTLLLPLQIAR